MLKNWKRGNPKLSGGTFLPPADNTYDLGSAAKSWRNIYVDTLIYVTSTVMLGDFLPSAAATYDLGSATYPWAEAYIGAATYHLKVAVASNVPTMYGVGAYLRVGDAATTQHSLDNEDDLMVTGDLEVHATFYPNAQTLGGTVTLNSQVFDAGSGNAQINTTGASTLTLQSTQDGADGASLLLRQVSANPANSDALAVIKAEGKDDGGTNRDWGYYQCRISDVQAASYTSEWVWWLRNSTALNLAMTLSGAGVVSPDHSIMFAASQDSAAVADQVSLGGYEISAGHRALAISSEEVVITEALTADRSYPIRINGVTYKMMLVAV